MLVGIERKPGYLTNRKWVCFLYYIFLFSRGRFINKMLFGPTLFSQNNPDDQLGETLGRLVWFGLVSLFNGISTLFRLFNAKAILLEEQ